MPQRILVLGASGYIGQHLVRTLSQQGHQILAAARHVDRLAKLQLANVSCHKVDPFTVHRQTVSGAVGESEVETKIRKKF